MDSVNNPNLYTYSKIISDTFAFQTQDNLQIFSSQFSNLIEFAKNPKNSDKLDTQPPLTSIDKDESKFIQFINNFTKQDPSGKSVIDIPKFADFYRQFNI